MEYTKKQRKQINQAKHLYESNRQSGHSIETCLSNVGHHLGVPSEKVWQWYQDGHLVDNERVEQQYEMINTLRDAGYTPFEVAEILYEMNRT